MVAFPAAAMSLLGFPITSWKYKHPCQSMWQLCNLTQAGNHLSHLLWWLRFKCRSRWKRRWRAQTHVITPFFINIYCITKATSRFSVLYTGLTNKVAFKNTSGLTRSRSASDRLNDPRQKDFPLQRTLISSPLFPHLSLHHVAIHPRCPFPISPASSLSPPPTAISYSNAEFHKTKITFSGY